MVSPERHGKGRKKGRLAALASGLAAFVIAAFAVMLAPSATPLNNAAWAQDNKPSATASTAPDGKEEPAVTAAESMDAVMWATDPIGGPFTLTDHDGKTRTEKDFLGKIVLVYFGFTHCPDICPADLMAIAGALNEIGDKSQQVQALFITVDPERDTQQLLKLYVDSFHERVLGLTGDAATIRRTANAFKVYYKKIPGDGPDNHSVDHSAYIYLYDQTGHYRGFFPPGTSADRIATVIKPLLKD